MRFETVASTAGLNRPKQIQDISQAYARLLKSDMNYRFVIDRQI
ncbi:hypothetical protein [Sphingobacterium sp. InxBP1]|nr:hypothetical protein [Sphingobacterium sp. InxBP1]